jgi:hypothetical protein
VTGCRGNAERCTVSLTRLSTATQAGNGHNKNITFAARQLELFAIRCLDLADRVAENQIGFLDAVDMAYSAAEWSGLTDNVGDDIVQACMAAAFANAKRPAR